MSDYNLGTARGVIEIEYNGNGPRQAQRDLGGVGQSARRTGPTLDSVGKKAGIAGAVIAAGFGVAIKSAADFEQQMSNVGAVSGANSSQMDALRKKALQLGKDTQYSASESAAAIEELVKAGISIPDVLNGAADSVVALAAAGGVTMPEAASIASNAMNQFGIKAKDMGAVVDNIAGAANASAIDVSDFGYSLGQVGAVAHLAGVDFKDTATAIALMGNAGIKGSDAGTSLKSMFMRLQPTTDKQMNTMLDLGIITTNLSGANKVLAKEGLGTAKTFDEANAKYQQLAQSLGKGTVGTMKNAKAAQDLMLKTGALRNQFYDAAGKTKSLAQVSGVLQKALKGMSNEQKQATLNTLFGSDAIRSAAILADNGSKGFEKMAKSMNKVSAADVAAKRMDNLKGSFEQFKGSLETAGITIGTMLLPALRKAVDGLTGVLNAFLNLPPGVQGSIAAFIGFLGVALLSLAAFVKIVRGIQAVRLAFIAVRAAAIPGWVAILGPWALIVAAIAAIVVAIVILWKHSETFRDIVTGVWNKIKSVVSGVSGWFTGTLVPALQSAWQSIQDGLAAMGSFFASVWNGIKTVIVTVFSAIVGVIKTYISFWAAVIGTALKIIGAVWHGFWNTFGGVIKAAFGLVTAIIKLAWVIIKGLFILQMRAILAVVRAVWNGVVAATRAVWGVIKAVVKAGLNFIRAIISRVFGVIRAVTGAIWNGIKAVIGAVWGAIGGTVMGALGRIKGAISSAWRTVKSLTSSAWNGLKGVVSKAVDGIMNVVDGIKDRVLGALSGAASWLYDKGREIVQGLLNGIESMISAVTDKIHSLTSKIAGFLPGSPVKEGPLRVLNNGYTGRKIVEMVIGGMDDMKRPLERTVNAIVQVPSLTKDLSSLNNARSASLSSSERASRGLGGSRGTITQQGHSRLVEGRLYLDKSGHAFIKGIAQDVVHGDSRFATTHGRMGG